jgi:hypothetical protein
LQGFAMNIERKEESCKEEQLETASDDIEKER